MLFAEVASLLMQRLFTMFPAGAAGIALVLLRISVVATFLADGAEHRWLLLSFWASLLFLSPALCLCAGLLTPYCAILCGLMQLAVLLMGGGNHRFDLAISILNAAILGVLGPGAYSLDARLFGRRVLSVPAEGAPPTPR